MIKFCPLSSGSKGNATFLEVKNTKILIDIGIGYKELSFRLEKLSVLPEEIDAIMITHEHRDHIEGLKTLLTKKNIPVFANATTAKNIYKEIKILPDYTIFTTDEIFFYKDLEVFPFTIAHDAGEPVGFIIYAEDKKIGYCCDVGFVTSLICDYLKKCDLLYVEANHDENLLMGSKRPDRLKKRILGRQGHLSNMECGVLVKNIIHEGLKVVYLAHLSKECNEEKKAYDYVKGILDEKMCEAQVFIAHQEKISELSIL